MEAPLSLRLLGGFLLRANARPRPLPVRKAQALLAYLALRAGRAHARDTLTDLLWSGTAGKQARQSLRQTMVRLRRALAGSQRAALVAQGDTVTLNPAALDVDVVQFEKLVRRGTPDALEAAVALYQGPLLDGFRVAEAPFEEWLESERARLHELALDALRRVVARHDKGGRLEQAIHAAGRLVALDPLQEDVHRTLMRLHARHGRRAAALRQYQACVAFLSKELGVEPEPETKRLYLEILQRAGPARGGGPRPGVMSLARLAPAAVDAPLIGRDAELAQIRQRLRAAWRGRGHVVLVKGEPGIGKSRLVAEITAAAMTEGSRVLVGHAYESEQILPFRPWVDALRSGRVVAQIAEGAAGSSATRSELARLFPELAGSAPPPPITTESHLRVFETLDALIAELTSTAPLLLVLEDLQWADELSLRLLSFVVRRLADRPVLLLGTCREGEETAVLQRTATELTAHAHVEFIHLAGLSQPATAALVRALARAGSSSPRLAMVVDRVWTVSEGSPFVIVEMMRAHREARLPDAGDVGLPQRVRDMIAARLARLSPRAQELARVAAVFTREFEFPVLQRAAGLGRRETAEAVEELVRRRILDAVGTGFDFTHVRLRQAVYEALLAPRRQTLHAAIGEAVESVYAGRLETMYERLAYHFAQADEPDRALTYRVHLADKVARTYALEEAVLILNEAAGYADRLPGPEGGRRRLEVIYRLAHVLSMLGRSAEVREVLLRHEALVASLREPSLSGTYHFWLAYTYGNLGDTASAYRHARIALEEAARGGDDLTMAKACYELARETYMMGRSGEGIAHGRQAVALLERSDERWWLGQALWVLSLHLLHVGDFAPALDAMDRMRVLGDALGEIRVQAYAAWTTGRIYTVMGEATEAIAFVQRGLALAVDPVARGVALGWLGAAHHEAEDPARAIPVLEDALAQLQQLSGAGGYRNRQIGTLLTSLLGEAHLMNGDVERAQELTQAALSLSPTAEWPVAAGYAERAAGRVALALKKIDDAEAAMRRALQIFTDCEAPAQVARTRLPLSEVLAARGDSGTAAAELATAKEMFVRMRVPRLVERTERLAESLGLRLG